MCVYSQRVTPGAVGSGDLGDCTSELHRPPLPKATLLRPGDIEALCLLVYDKDKDIFDVRIK